MDFWLPHFQKKQNRKMRTINDHTFSKLCCSRLTIPKTHSYFPGRIIATDPDTKSYKVIQNMQWIYMNIHIYIYLYILYNIYIPWFLDAPSSLGLIIFGSRSTPPRLGGDRRWGPLLICCIPGLADMPVAVGSTLRILVELLGEIRGKSLLHIPVFVA